MYDISAVLFIYFFGVESKLFTFYFLINQCPHALVGQVLRKRIFHRYTVHKYPLLNTAQLSSDVSITHTCWVNVDVTNIFPCRSRVHQSKFLNFLYFSDRPGVISHLRNRFPELLCNWNGLVFILFCSCFKKLAETSVFLQSLPSGFDCVSSGHLDKCMDLTWSSTCLF